MGLVKNAISVMCLVAAGPVTAAAGDSADHADYLKALRGQYSEGQSYWPPAITTDNIAPVPMQALPQPEKADAGKVALGEALFNDTMLSRDHTVSCATCHAAHLVFADRRRQAVGIDGQVGRRNTPALFGINLWTSLFWDGRANSAQHQALFPVSDPKEMDLPVAELVKRVNQNEKYASAFAAAYGISEIKSVHLADAIAQFERQIPPPDTPFQQVLQRLPGEPEVAIGMLSDEQLWGLHLFRTKARCMTCHEGALLSDNQFHNTGLSYYGRKFEDLGRYEVTGLASDVGRFRTPSLVAVSHTGPWMHNGLFSSLPGVVNLYNAGGARTKRREAYDNDPLYPETTPLLVKLELTKEERSALVAFLTLL
ncbi:MAG: cytochrome c peroxidase [Pseudomonadota bacterium]|nr:cytochrome c peroxidase [Pseudomonadota bacterium]